MTRTLYLDHAATTPVRPEVLEAMWPHLAGGYGNPSSTHDIGRSAAAALADAREQVAAVLGCRPTEVTFTSGGTEADNLAVKGIALGRPRGRHLVTSAIEHPAILESCEYLARMHGFEVSIVGVDASGLVDPASLAAAMRDDTTLVTVMTANNEVGTVQPIEAIANAARARGIPAHTDAVQAAGWLDVSMPALAVDSVSLAGHKIGAPKGTGVLATRGRLPFEPLLHGGGQERGRRSGTENVAGAVAFATALRLAEREREQAAAASAAVRDRFIGHVLHLVPNARLTGHPELRLPGTASFVFPGASGEAVLLELEARAVTCSSGSACAAGQDDPSPVLLAMGFSAMIATTSVRFSFGAETTTDELDAVAVAVREAVHAVRGIAG
ncbi:cysteine desulfurase family protein [Diaminobutyricimonas sp. TR449]|uniref:cysteine desulfurase family protein n=1 Tax=Diaminobutyricimonas sp. TR449 TaxID=2708076 RepID=UPI0014210A4F|nr:cysteine desulfurase family protein [Diaminobutyricimonas sp. TR449]